MAQVAVERQLGACDAGVDSDRRTGEERVPSDGNAIEEVEAGVVHRRREPAVERHLGSDRRTAISPGHDALDPPHGRHLENDVE